MCYHPFLVSVLFSGASLLALNFYRKFSIRSTVGPTHFGVGRLGTVTFVPIIIIVIIIRYYYSNFFHFLCIIVGIINVVVSSCTPSMVVCTPGLLIGMILPYVFVTPRLFPGIGLSHSRELKSFTVPQTHPCRAGTQHSKWSVCGDVRLAGLQHHFKPTF